MTDADAADAAAAVQRLAVLLEAGVSPVNAWTYAAEDGDPVAVAVTAEVRAGVALGAALGAVPGAWREVAVAWRVAETVGAPLAPSLRRFADALREAQQSRDDVAVALADPAATAKLVAWLPLVAIVLGIALGFDVTATFGNPFGIACVVAGIALMLAARAWTRRLVRRAQPGQDIAGLQGDVVAIALTGGVSIERALAVVAEAGGGDPAPETERVLALSRRAGAPAVDLLRSAAAEARRQVRTDGRLRAARLSARLLLPLGVCTLPAFLLLGVGPMLLSVLSGATPVLGSP